MRLHGRLSGSPDATDRESRMQPARRRPWSTSRCRRQRVTADAPIARKVLARLRLSDIVVPRLTRAAALVVLVILGGVIVSLIVGSLAGAARPSASAS